jgi:hypothetical protein
VNASNASAATARSSSTGSTPHLSTRCPGQLAYRIAAFLRARREDPQALIILRERNRHALRELWARAPADALGVKQELEKALAQHGKPPT